MQQQCCHYCETLCNVADDEVTVVIEVDTKYVSYRFRCPKCWNPQEEHLTDNRFQGTSARVELETVDGPLFIGLASDPEVLRLLDAFA